MSHNQANTPIATPAQAVRGLDVSHLSPATQRAIRIFNRHEVRRFYTERMLKVEDAAVAAIPPEEFSEYVRITSALLR